MLFDNYDMFDITDEEMKSTSDVSIHTSASFDDDMIGHSHTRHYDIWDLKSVHTPHDTIGFSNDVYHYTLNDENLKKLLHDDITPQTTRPQQGKHNPKVFTFKPMKNNTNHQFSKSAFLLNDNNNNNLRTFKNDMSITGISHDGVITCGKIINSTSVPTPTGKNNDDTKEDINHVTDKLSQARNKLRQPTLHDIFLGMSIVIYLRKYIINSLTYIKHDY